MEIRDGKNKRIDTSFWLIHPCLVYWINDIIKMELSPFPVSSHWLTNKSGTMKVENSLIYKNVKCSLSFFMDQTFLKGSFWHKLTCFGFFFMDTWTVMKTVMCPWREANSLNNLQVLNCLRWSRCCCWLMIDQLHVSMCRMDDHSARVLGQNKQNTQKENDKTMGFFHASIKQ